MHCIGPLLVLRKVLSTRHFVGIAQKLRWVLFQVQIFLVHFHRNLILCNAPQKEHWTALSLKSELLRRLRHHMKSFIEKACNFVTVFSTRHWIENVWDGSTWKGYWEGNKVSSIERQPDVSRGSHARFLLTDLSKTLNKKFSSIWDFSCWSVGPLQDFKSKSK